jgi:hypothetical protein
VASAASIDEIANDAAAMHLHMAKGVGLNDDGIRKATKVVLLAPPSIDVLGKQVGVFSVLCTALFGQQSDVVTELGAIIQHITKHEIVYQNMQSADKLFATRFTCLIDHKVQLYLGDCLNAQSPDEVSTTMLSFAEVQCKVLEGMFESKLIPSVVHQQISHADTGGHMISGGSNRPRCDGGNGGHEKRGRKVPNRNFRTQWRVQKNDRMIGFFITRLAWSGPRWGQ